MRNLTFCELLFIALNLIAFYLLLDIVGYIPLPL